MAERNVRRVFSNRFSMHLVRPSKIFVWGSIECCPHFYASKTNRVGLQTLFYHLSPLAIRKMIETGLCIYVPKRRFCTVENRSIGSFWKPFHPFSPCRVLFTIKVLPNRPIERFLDVPSSSLGEPDNLGVGVICYYPSHHS